jgi:Flp pilus assembly protein TadD
MKVTTSHFVAALFGASLFLVLCGTGRIHTAEARQTEPNALKPLTIDYPLNGSVFPPEITPPTFLWHDQNESVKHWVVEVFVRGSRNPIRIDAPGDLMKQGETDPNAGPMVALTAEQASTRTWRPDPQLWANIKKLSVKSPARITIEGFADANHPVSIGTVSISTSKDPVGAPIFYRDVPLLLPPANETGPISPLPRTAIPFIKWRIRNIGDAESRVVMSQVPTCANCHSFSRDGKTLGIDLDGPRNDKGLYAVVPTEKQMTIQNTNVVRWSSFGLNNEARGDDPAVKRFGFMSQVSPEGRYVVTSIGPPNNTSKNDSHEPGFASGLLDRLYSINYRSIDFIQVFYPTRGILAWYDRTEHTMRPLPGADDPNFVQTSAFWSPDAKYLVFSRAAAREPFPAGVPASQFANDPNETQIQYDLYKIPFNNGHGGKAEPILGASNNGMSNNFPKVSPDGKWIVFVQNKNGLLMRPDSKLYIVPFNGGTPRLMNCNLSLMNSWHTFSPNGRWLAFSSKARGPYTRLMLTHIDENGNDTPAVIVDDTTAANRAVNIPEFLNASADNSIEKINPRATDFYRLFDEAYKMIEDNDIAGAIKTLTEATKDDPDDSLGHFMLGTALSASDREPEALVEYRKAVALSPRNPKFLGHLAISLELNGDVEGALEQLKKAIDVDPRSVEYRFNLGFVLESRGDFFGAVSPLQEAVELSKGNDWKCLVELARVYDKVGRPSDAVRSAKLALDLLREQNDMEDARHLKSDLDRYESELDVKAN